MLKNRFGYLPIDQKLYLVLGLPLIVMLAVSLVAVQVALGGYDRKFSQSTVKELEYFMEKVDGSIGRLESFSYQLAMNYDTQLLLYENFKIDDYPKYEYAMRAVMLRFLQEITVTDAAESFIYSDGKRMRYANGKKVTDVPEALYLEIVGRAHEAGGRLVYGDPTDGFPYLLSARDIRYFINADLTYLGTLVFVTDLTSIVAPYEDALGIGQNYLFIEHGNTRLYANAPELAADVRAISDSLPDRGYTIRNVGGTRYFICSTASTLTGWRFLDMFPYGVLFASSLRGRLYLVIAFVALYSLGFFAVRKLSLLITGPVKDLSDSMAIVKEGKFEEALAALGGDFPSDEIGMLKADYALMLETIRKLIRENYETQLVVKDTEYRALKAQINPHFLYNTLNSIGWMVDLGQNADARRMLVSLGNLLHRAIRPEFMIAVEDEIALLEDYLFIQRIRYEDRAVFSLRVEAGLSRVMIPQMILQPLVENAVYHGIDVSLAPCRVSVTIASEDGLIVMCVSDDGPGMDEQTLEAIRSFSYRKEKGGIGLKNIHDRLSLLYAGGFTFVLDSELGKGTTVMIGIPESGHNA